LDTPPPGAGLTTVIVAVVGEAMSEAGIAAVNFELFTKVVVLELPFQSTVEPEMKPVPVTVKVKAAPPGTAASGCRGFKYGTGLLVVERTRLGHTKEKTPARTNGEKLCNNKRFMLWLLSRTKRSPGALRYQAGSTIGLD